jgi:hypothetical protein
MKRTCALILGCGFASAVLTTPVRAEAQDRAAAVAAFEEAERLTAAGQHVAACPKYAESYRLDPQLGALLHMADCYEKTGRFASAWGAFREGKELAQKKNDPRASLAEERAAKLEPRLSRLSISVPDSTRVTGLEIRRDGIIVGEALWGTAIPVDPGTRVVQASAPGRKSVTSSIEVTGEGQTQTFTLPPLVTDTTVSPENPGAQAGMNLRASEPAGDDRGSMQRLAGWSAVGAGGVGLGVGLIFILRRSSKLSDRDGICPSGNDCSEDEIARIDQLTDEARSASTVSTIGFVAGGLFTAGGLALVFTAPKRREAAISAQPLIARDLLGAGVAGSF